MSVAARTAAIVGVGYTEFSRTSGRSVLDLARAASADALDDAGIAAGDVDGVGSFMVMHDSVKCQAVATTLAVPGLRWSVDLDLGGQAPCHLVGLAASAIATGQAEVVVLYRAMNGRSGRASAPWPSTGRRHRGATRSGTTRTSCTWRCGPSASSPRPGRTRTTSARSRWPSAPTRRATNAPCAASR